MRLAPVFLALFALPLAVLAGSTDPSASLRGRMSPADFHAAGLDKLSADELAHLDAWLAAHPTTRTKVVDASGQPVFYTDKQKRTAIEAHLVGRFDGWNGRNLMTLDNGQQWKQVGSDQPACGSADAPAVKVKPSLFGGWLMYVDGCNGSVHVERVK
ncbi:MAG: hypothetical protein B7X33_05090 [Lysobacterales bacterium 13-68-4]|jgi:hypothetical protein|nr:MAG: hypothetical protein B7X45_10685 [Xanthomonadales bacterium 15-68-25]OZB65420.1 MAG: hypothetical protein B7X33_05090 [Xanthomonadales bacterium 13-68-4]OZB65798.1 MAG: hypothetical protein B7X39_12940 [Xanthomonadales bacterium 14-68-21]